MIFKDGVLRFGNMGYHNERRSLLHLSPVIDRLCILQVVSESEDWEEMS